MNGMSVDGSRSNNEFGYTSVPGVNYDATKHFITMLQRKIELQRKELSKVNAQLAQLTSSAVQQLTQCESDVTQQQKVKKKLQKDQSEMRSRALSIEKTIRKLEFKLSELKLNGIPKHAVPDDYVRHIKRKDANSRKEQARTIHTRGLPRDSSGRASSSLGSDPLLEWQQQQQQQQLYNSAGRSVAAKSHSLDRNTPAEAVREYSAIAPSERLTDSSSDALQYKSMGLLDDDEDSKSNARSTGARSIRSQQPSRSKGSSSAAADLDEELWQHSLRLPQFNDSSQSETIVVKQLHQEIEASLEQQRSFFKSELEKLQKELQGQSDSIHRQVSSQFRSLRNEQQKLSACIEAQNEALKRAQLYASQLEHKVQDIINVDAHVDAVNDRIQKLSRELQNPSSSRSIDNSNSCVARLLNLAITLLSYGFVFISCLISLLFWLFGLFGKKPFIALILATTATVLLVYNWTVVAHSFPQLLTVQHMLQTQYPNAYQLAVNACEIFKKSLPIN